MAMRCAECNKEDSFIVEKGELCIHCSLNRWVAKPNDPIMAAWVPGWTAWNDITPNRV